MVSQYARKTADIRPTVWVSLDSAGALQTREQTQDERLAQVIPPKGEYRLRVIAFAEPFEMPKAEQFGGGMQEMTRVLLEVVDGPGKGKQTTLLCSFAVSKRSNLGKIYGATVGLPEAGDDWDPVAMLNKEFVAYLQPSKNVDDNGKPKGTDCSWDTVARVGGETEAAQAEALWA